jgi:hypothetical protein
LLIIEIRVGLMITGKNLYLSFEYTLQGYLQFSNARSVNLFYVGIDDRIVWIKIQFAAECSIYDFYRMQIIDRLALFTATQRNIDRMRYKLAFIIGC